MLSLRAVPILLYHTYTSSCFQLFCISMLEPQGVEAVSFGSPSCDGFLKRP